MPEGYKTYKPNDFIKKSAEGQFDLQKSLDLVKELVTASGFHKEHDLLIDLKETDPLENFGDLLTVAFEFAKYQDAFPNKIAVIIPNTPDRIERAKFFIASLGYVNFQLQYFTDFEDALDWLSTIKKFPEDS
jgi:hypothetical protein